MSFFNNLKILPRWFIVLLDLMVVFVATVLGYFIRFNFELTIEQQYSLVPSVTVFLLLVAVAMLCTKAYAGIVRHTSTRDLGVMFLTLFLSLGFLQVLKYLNVGFRVMDPSNFLPASVALIGILFSLFLLVSYRLVVKQIFLFAKTLHVKKGYIKVVVFGAGEAGLMTYRSLMNDPKTLRYPVAFLDDDSNKSSKLIDGKKIYFGLDNLENLLKEKGIEEVIVAVRDFPSKRLVELTDECLRLNLKLKTIPPSNEWINGSPSSEDIRDVKIEDLLGRDEIQLESVEVLDFLDGKTVLVTGAAGSIGSELCRQISQTNVQKLILLDIAESPLYDLEQDFKLNTNFVDKKFVVGDIRDRQTLSKLIEKERPDVVFHAAAYKHVPLMEEYPHQAIKTNVIGTKNLADLSVTFGVEKFIMVSTDKAVNPTNVMGATKRLAEMYVQSLNQKLYKDEVERTTKFITTRFGNVLGSNGSVIPLFKKQLMMGGPLTITHPNITRYFMTIPEACLLVIEAGTMGAGGEIFVFDMGRPVKIVDLAKRMIKLAGKEPGEDIEIIFTGLRPGEKLYEELLNEEELVKETHHPKIKIADVMEFEFGDLKNGVGELTVLSQSADDFQLVEKLKELVPEFVSNVSKFSLLDKID